MLFFSANPSWKILSSAVPGQLCVYVNLYIQATSINKWACVCMSVQKYIPINMDYFFHNRNLVISKVEVLWVVFLKDLLDQKVKNQKVKNSFSSWKLL